MIEHDVIGVITAVPASFDEDFNQLSPPQYLPGFHVNFTELPEVLAQYQVFPVNPSRIYAGTETIFLRFADEAEWTDAFELLEVING